MKKLLITVRVKSRTYHKNIIVLKVTSHCVRRIISLCLLVTCYLLLVTSSALADEQCPDNFYYPDSDLNACVYKHGGYLDTEGCVYAFEQVDDSLCVAGEETPAPPEPSPLSGCGTSPENAVCNLNNSLLPPEVIKDIKPKDESLFSSIINQIQSLFATIFGFAPKNKNDFASRSEIQHQTLTPPEVKPNPSLNPIEQTEQNLGKNTGVFSVDLPEEVKKELDKTIDFSKAYEKAHFPEGINPITK